MREIIFDTETTGFEPAEHRLVEIGCVELVGRLPTGRTFQRYLNPEREIDASATRVHGITSAHVADKPTFAQVVPEFLEFVGGAPLVAHNASFDLGFLNMELTRAGHAPWAGPVVDTLQLARQKLPGQRASLDALCRFYNIDLSARTLHGALLDAHLLAEVYVELLGGLQGNLLTSGGDKPATASSVAINHTHQTTLHTFLTTPPTEAELAAHQTFLSNSLSAALWLKD